MTAQQLANVFNLTGIGLVVLVSLTVLRNYPSPFFRVWTIGYACGCAMMVMEALALWIGRPIAMSVLEIAALLTTAWCFTRAALLQLGRAMPWKWYRIGLPIALTLSAALLATGTSHLLVAALPLLLFSGTLIGLGVVLIRRHLAPNGARSSWIGGPLILLGLLPATYPLIELTSYSWVGYWLGGLLHLLVGMGMVIYALEESAENLRQQNERLTQLSQLKTSFLSIISHELRTPLTSVIGYLEFLDDRIGGPLTSLQAEFVDHMKESSSQLAGLIDSLLDSHQIEAGALEVRHEAVDLAKTLDRIVNALRSLLDKKDIRLEIVLEPAVPMVWADPRRVIQVLNNLIGNAIKFTEPGGSIRLESRPEGDRLRVAVIDTGIGIPDGQLAQIFDPFFQIDSRLVRQHGGSGLGLSIVRSMVQAMGGQVGVESQQGQGSVFWFTLPLMAPSAPEEDGAISQQADPGHFSSDGAGRNRE